MLEKVPPVAKEQRIAVASVRTPVKVRGEDVFINTNGEMVGRACRVFHILVQLQHAPTLFGDCCLVCGRETYFPLSQLLGELAYGESQPSSTVHTTGGMETYIPLSLCYATWHPVTTTIHHWWKGNKIYIPLSQCWAT